MYELPKEIPDPEVLLSLEPEELAAKMLFLMRDRVQREPHYMPNLNNDCDGPFTARSDEFATYPNAQRDAIYIALAEAWSWLEAQGLLVSAPGGNGNAGFRILSRRARKFVDEAEFANYAVARRLPKETLHPSISGPVWMSFMRGDFETAAFQAMKAVEVAVRDAASLEAADIGVNLVRKAFNS